MILTSHFYVVYIKKLVTVLYFSIINVFYLLDLCGAGGDASFAPQANLVSSVYSVVDETVTAPLFLIDESTAKMVSAGKNSFCFFFYSENCYGQTQLRYNNFQEVAYTSLFLYKRHFNKFRTKCFGNLNMLNDGYVPIAVCTVHPSSSGL